LGPDILLGTSFSRNSESSIKVLDELKFWSKVENTMSYILSLHTITTMLKSKAVPLHAMEAHGVRGGIAAIHI
jgi:hypothetical protein